MTKNKQKNINNHINQIKKSFDDSDKSLCIFVNNQKESKILLNELKLLTDIKIVNFPENEILPYDHFSSPSSVIKKRFKVLNKIDSKKHILISTAKNVYERYPPINFYETRSEYFEGDLLSLNDLIFTAENLSYVKKDTVQDINEFAVRGGIIDIFTPIYENPLRIEIFDNQIISIRFFDAKSQHSLRTIDSFALTAGLTSILNEKKVEFFKGNWRSYFKNNDERECDIFNKISNKNLPEGFEIYLPLFFKNTINFFEIFNNHNFLFFNDAETEIKDYGEYINDRFKDENIDHSRPLMSPKDLFISNDFINKKIKGINTVNQICNEELIKIKKNDNEHNINQILKLFNQNKNKILLLTTIPSEIERLKNLYRNKLNIISSIEHTQIGLNLMMYPIVNPVFEKAKSIFIYHLEYFSPTESINQSHELQSNEFTEQTFVDNDYVIHENYGLGIYKGLEKVSIKDAYEEFIKISYSNNENLYVPLRNINLITRYHKKEHLSDIKLDSLSSGKWLKKREKAKKRSIDHAAEILNLEARRNIASANQLIINKNEYDKFVNEFPYIETNDQKVAIDQIIKDISLIKPMNRVLCGDVGFGKTEVSMRAAFVSAFSGNQTILLCPSTVLSNQHFQSFIKRFKNFPVTISLLNRHTSRKEKDEILEKYNNNQIDILITTHIIFTSNIKFKKTGLLIIDEEHKFGIKQKNIIKENKENIHILSLSATPIPRTMNLVFSGLQDFSFLQQPPSNRLNIKSFIKIQKLNLLKEAISREVARGGQCFIVENNIKKMKGLEDNLKEILPSIKIDIAHGKLNKKEINKSMTSFSNGSLDVIICTTIVEMGLDIPNANTMIIVNSQNFGLAQLHQLRGRVGRSQKQAYCYFLIPSFDIPKKSKSRLDSVINFSSLGQGYFIAQEDLELRGGGEMLGEKQSGHIADVGMSLYLSMLKEALNDEGDDPHLKDDLDINFFDEAYINNEYLPSPIERLKIYKKINKANTDNEIFDIKNNLVDRCGKLTTEVENLIKNALLKIKIKNSGIIKIKSSEMNTKINFAENLDDKIQSRVIKLLTDDAKQCTMIEENTMVIKIIEKDSNIRREKVYEFLEKIL